VVALHRLNDLAAGKGEQWLGEFGVREDQAGIPLPLRYRYPVTGIEQVEPAADRLTGLGEPVPEADQRQVDAVPNWLPCCDVRRIDRGGRHEIIDIRRVQSSACRIHQPSTKQCRIVDAALQDRKPESVVVDTDDDGVVVRRAEGAWVGTGLDIGSPPA
jgi:hypothetical protein